jgi:hypothetical protein
MKKIMLFLLVLFLSSCVTTLKPPAPVQDATWKTATIAGADVTMVQTPMSTSMTGAPVSTSGTFSIDMPISIDFSVLKNLLLKKYSTETFSGIDLKILDATIYGINDNELVIGLNIDAKKQKSKLEVKGWVYLRGIPDIDVDTQILTVKNVKLDAKTQQHLVNFAVWLASPIVSYEAKKFSFDLGKIVDSKKNMFSDYSMAGYGNLNLIISKFSLYGFDISPTTLIARIAIEGTVSVVVNIK